jgi:hypothetical protein
LLDGQLPMVIDKKCVGGKNILDEKSSSYNAEYGVPLCRGDESADVRIH